MRKAKSFFLVSGFWFLVSGFIMGCGYTTGSLVPAGLEAIYVQTFSNKTYQPRVEIDITNEVINGYMNDGSLRLVEKEDADVMLVGELIDYIKQPLRYTDTEEVEEYRLTLVVEVSLQNLKEGRLLWEERLSGDTTYFTIGARAKTEEVAKDLAVEDLARRIVDRTVKGW